MTLIEIVAGLVVLAVLISSVTLARGRFMRQWSEADRKLHAAQAVDRMLAGWLGRSDSDVIPVPSRGKIDGVEGCTWQTLFIPENSATRLGARVVRLEVFDDHTRLFAIDLLKHMPTASEREKAP